ncbi:signal peptidase I [Taibaiella soli]|uniref:Signal peptidase I n=1 Tax=Taibaiella soli TaxID=1649169 RepID=A0A2W2AG25_9BACT|nr:signal peptidase I [Taibaiella soli]PZF72462.1 signal peptidase I [Taibaiella soli]
MSKSLKIGLGAAVVVGLWVVGRITEAVQWYKIPTPSNYPTIKVGDHILASNLVKPERFNFICFYATGSDMVKQIWIQRLCGLEGDTIEIRNGVLLVNNKYADSNFSPGYLYIMSRSESEKIPELIEQSEMSTVNAAGDSTTTCLSDKIVRDHGLNAERVVLATDEKDEMIEQRYKTSWNADHFGPIVVPRGKYFVLGDNRRNAMDSRYIGFIDKSDYIGTVLGR